MAPTLIYGRFENAGGEEYLNLYSNLDDVFEEDCTDQEVLVFKFAHKALAERKTSTKTNLKRKKR